MKKLLLKTKKGLIIDYLRFERRYLREYDLYVKGDYEEIELSRRATNIEELRVMSRKELIAKIKFFKEGIKNYEFMTMIKQKTEFKESR